MRLRLSCRICERLHLTNCLQPTQPNRVGAGLVTSTIGENYDGDGGAGRKISDVRDTEIKCAIRECVRSNPNQDELLQAVRQTLGLARDSESIRRRIIGV